MNQDFISQTPLDQITGTDYGQMLKAAIPNLPARSRQILSIYEKAIEFRNTVSIFGKRNYESDLTAASTTDTDPMDMLNDIRSFCYGPARSKLDQLVNMMAMVQMVNIINQPEYRKEDSNEGSLK